MALSTVTVTLDLHQLLGDDFDARGTRAWVTTNVVNQTLMDTSTGETRMGDQKVTIAADGTGSFTTWAPGADGNPISWQTTLHVDYQRAGNRDRTTRAFGPYTITANSTLADLEEEQAVPAEYLTAVTEALDAHAADLEAGLDIYGADAIIADVAAAAGSATAAAGSATSASGSATAAAGSATAAAGSATAAAGSSTSAGTAKTAAETARDAAIAAKVAAEAVGSTNDTIIASRINDSASATTSALSASIDATIGTKRSSFSVKVFGAVGDGTTDDTVAIRTALDYIAALGLPHADLYFPAGTYRVTRILHPIQPTPNGFLADNLTIFKVPDGVRLVGAGRGATKISIEYANLTSSATSDSMAVFVVGDDFEAEGIHFHGNYNPGTWAFFPLNNNNILFGAGRAMLYRHSIQGCRFTNLPGFSVGTMVVKGADFTDNLLYRCANGYNVSGSDITVSGNTFVYCEGVESAGNTSDSDGTGGRISVVDNRFYECNVAASLGGNTGTASTDDSFGYTFANNQIVNEAVAGTNVVGILNNARTFAVTGNSIRGKFKYAIIVTTGGQPASTTPRDGSISSNTVDQSYDATSDGPGACIAISHADGDVAVTANMLLAGPGQPVFQVNMVSPATAYVHGNVLKGRYIVTYTTGQTGMLDLGPNSFTNTDGTPRYSLAAGSAMDATTYRPSTRRVPIPSDTQAGTTPELVVRRKGDGSETTDTQGIYKRYYDGSQEFGAPAGGSPDVWVGRVAASIYALGADDGFRPGVTTTAGRPAASARTNCVMIDSDLHAIIYSDGSTWKVIADLSGTTYVDLGIPSTCDPRMCTAAVGFTANVAGFWKIPSSFGSKTTDQIAFYCSVSSGNISVGHYANSGVGASAVPGARDATTGIIACPAVGRAVVTMGASVSITPGSWLAMSCDNATARFGGQSALSGNLTIGLSALQGTAHPLPSSYGGSAGFQTLVALQGV